jgi:hypothetical protein
MLSRKASPPGNPDEIGSWRTKNRIKTSSAILALCLHLGIDPPDIIRPQPGANQIAGIELPNKATASSSDQKLAAEQIASSIQNLFEYWHPRGHYKTIIDPPFDELKKACNAAIRKPSPSNSINSTFGKEERVLFYYNGWGVPKPTSTKNGELWVFNSSYTQYLPLNVVELDSWLNNGPVLIILECPNSNLIINHWHRNRANETSNSYFYAFGASSSAELPSVPGLPADLFTSCLVNPLPVALQFSGSTQSNINAAIKGKLSDRSTPLGQLHWIFTAITDTIGWQLFPMSLFKQYYRQDVLLASIFRNFLLAQRIMRAYGCIPISVPEVPFQGNELWCLWDCLIDRFNNISEEGSSEGEGSRASIDLEDFFGDHLEAFERYLTVTKSHQEHSADYPYLPIVLQMLLSQQHRVRALETLVSFMDIHGARSALDVGIYPYLLKLLHSSEMEAREALSHVWLRLLLFDPSTADDLKSATLPFFLPKEGDDKDQVAILLACLYLIENRLGHLGMDIDPEIDSPWVYILASTSRQSSTLGAFRKDDSDDVNLLIRLFIDLIEPGDWATFAYHKDPIVRRYFIRWLFQKYFTESKNSNDYRQNLEEMKLKDPWKVVKEECDLLLQAIEKATGGEKNNSAPDEPDSGRGGVDSLSKRAKRNSLEKESVETLLPVPEYLIRSKFIKPDTLRSIMNIESEISAERIGSTTNLYRQIFIGKKEGDEQVKLESGYIIGIEFDLKLPSVILVFLSNGVVSGINYETGELLFSQEADIPVFSDQHAYFFKAESDGFRTEFGESVFIYNYDLPRVIISSPPKVNVLQVAAYRSKELDTRPHPDSSISCDGIIARLNTDRVIHLEISNKRHSIELPPGGQPDNDKKGFFSSLSGVFGNNPKKPNEKVSKDSSTPIYKGCLAWHGEGGLLAVGLDQSIYLYH